MKVAPQAKPARASWVRPHTAGWRSRAGKAYARRRWHTPVRQSVLNSLAPGPVGRTGRRMGWSRPRSHVPQQTGPARREATGRRPDRLGRSLGRPVQAYVRKRETKRRVKAPVKPAAPGRGRGRGSLE